MVSSQGAIVRQFKFSADGDAPAWDAKRPQSRIECGPDGHLIYLGTVSHNFVPGQVMLTAAGNIFTADRDGLIISKYIRPMAASEWVTARGSTGTWGQFTRPLGLTSYLARVGPYMVFASSDSARLTAFKPVAHPKTVARQKELEIDSVVQGRSIDLALTPQPISPPELQAAAEQTAAATSPSQDYAEAIVSAMMLLPAPKTAPLMSGIFGDTEGLLWVQTSGPGASRTELVAVKLDGRVVGRIRFPMSVEVYEIGRDYVVGLYHDKADEGRVAVWKLTGR